MGVDEEAAGHARQAMNMQVAAVMLHFGKGGADAVRMATLLGIPLSLDWGKNTFPQVARHYKKNAETLALHACDINLATETKIGARRGRGKIRAGGRHSSALQRTRSKVSGSIFFRCATRHHLQLQ